ncbi:CBS domain-containing protein [Candidatus Woesearchaeota archaeon]|nr:CBS domain-containing protein [Candidatus Woesearchaeota archaeon]
MIAKDILTKKYVKISLDDTVSQMLGKMRRGKTHHALVFEGKKYLGLVGKKFLLTSRIDPHTMKVRNIIKKRSKSKTPFFVPILSLDTSAKEMARLMNTADVTALPVMSNDKIIGIVEAADLANAIAAEYKQVPVKDLATMKVQTLKYTDELGKLLQLMTKRNITHVPIVDEKAKIVGLVSAGNLMEEFQLWRVFEGLRIPENASHENGKRSGYGVRDKIHTLRVPVDNIMVTEVCCTAPGTKVPKAVQMMKGVTSIVLTENEKPVGIMTFKDLFKDYAKSA